MARNSPCPNCGYCPHCGRGGGHGLYPHPRPIWTRTDNDYLSTDKNDVTLSTSSDTTTTDYDFEESRYYNVG